MRVNAPAKINLHLRVGPPTPDGFHPLLTWMVTVGLFDTLDVRLRDEPGVALACDDPALPTDGTNLVSRGATALLEAAAVVEHGAGIALAPAAGATVSLRKRIPTGAGLGGGSADGAAVITALDRLLQLGWPADRLADLSARLGSDLPFFFHGPSSVCTGRGEVVRPIARPKPRWAVLVLPPIHMPTPAVYRKYDELGLGDATTISAEPDWARLTGLTANELLPELVNDLEAPAFAISSKLAELREAAQSVVGRIVRMSGSGSSLFTLYDAAADASASAEKLRAKLGVRTVAVELCPALGAESSVPGPVERLPE
ncbi:MAG TPA: 4-(cytidine 5'-diphospho)-2-C-methyl-D-erythritol kinase [Tepidisphaeraceae bacterium]|nr:4-(cytidine 5'-diphospho)-2-C-methyl-D-erythritol kinase [Tepidisphaeraceae bacterium]